RERERRIRRQTRDDTRNGLIGHDRVRATHYRLAVPEYIPGKTHSRLEVKRALLVRLRSVNQKISGGIEYHEAVSAFGWRAVPVISQTQFDREVRPYLPGVQRKCANRADEDTVGAVGRVRRKLTGLIVDKRRDGREGESPRCEAEVIVVDPAIFASEFQGVIAARPTQRVRCYRRVVAPALGKAAYSSE